MIETKRLILRPLTYNQVLKYIKADNSLEHELNLNSTSRTISPELKEAFEQTILPNLADEKNNHLYATLWTAISKAENKMIGDLCFTGPPNEVGEIEIGYGTYEESRRQGFMTEAVGGMITWAKDQPAIRSIFAATEKTNNASWSVLEKNNFLRFDETETFYHWRIIV